MSILIPTGQSRTGITIPDAGPRTRGPRLRRSRPLARATVAAYWAASAITALLAWLSGTRNTAWANAFHSRLLVDVVVATDATDRTLLVWRASWVVIALALAATVVWTHVLASNARSRGVPGVRPTRAAASWLVPLFGPPAAIRQLGRFVREFDYSERRLWFWLFGLYVHSAVMIVGQVVVFIGFKTAIDHPGSLAALQRQTQVFWLQAGMSVVLTVLATRAVLHADRAVSGAVSGARPRAV